VTSSRCGYGLGPNQWSFAVQMPLLLEGGVSVDDLVWDRGSAIWSPRRSMLLAFPRFRRYRMVRKFPFMLKWGEVWTPWRTRPDPALVASRQISGCNSFTCLWTHKLDLFNYLPIHVLNHSPYTLTYSLTCSLQLHVYLSFQSSEFNQEPRRALRRDVWNIRKLCWSMGNRITSSYI